MCASAARNNTWSLQIIWRQFLILSKRCFFGRKSLCWVWHDGLFYKLKCFGICGIYYNRIQSFLNNRHQSVVLNDQSSKWSLVEAGVSQGSILGPLLFLFTLMVCHKDCVVMQNYLLTTLHFSKLSLVLLYRHQVLMKSYWK